MVEVDKVVDVHCEMSAVGVDGDYEWPDQI